MYVHLCLSVCVQLCPSVRLYVHLCLSVCLSVCMFTCVCLSMSSCVMSCTTSRRVTPARCRSPRAQWSVCYNAATWRAMLSGGWSWGKTVAVATPLPTTWCPWLLQSDCAPWLDGSTDWPGSFVSSVITAIFHFVSISSTTACLLVMLVVSKSCPRLEIAWMQGVGWITAYQ